MCKHALDTTYLTIVEVDEDCPKKMRMENRCKQDKYFCFKADCEICGEEMNDKRTVKAVQEISRGDTKPN